MLPKFRIQLDMPSLRGHQTPLESSLAMRDGTTRATQTHAHRWSKPIPDIGIPMRHSFPMHSPGMRHAPATAADLQCRLFTEHTKFSRQQFASNIHEQHLLQNDIVPTDSEESMTFHEKKTVTFRCTEHITERVQPYPAVGVLSYSARFLHTTASDPHIVRSLTYHSAKSAGAECGIPLAPQ